MTLTTRLSLFFLAALTAVLVGFSAALYLLADAHLRRQLDERLEAAAQTLASGAEVDPDGVEWEPHGRPRALGPGAFGERVHWAVTTDDGRVLDRSPQPGAEDLLAEAARVVRAGRRTPRRLDHAGEAWRVTEFRIAAGALPPAGAEPGKYPALVLTVAAPLGPVHATLRTLAAALAGLTLVVLAGALVGGRAVCRRALAPVRRMAGAARAMGAADRSERLPVPPAADELADLGRAFNGLLDRLGEAFERERRFAGEASHQLRTPLAGLIGQAEVALRRDRPAEEYRRVLETVLAQAGRLRRVVEALLFLARSEADAGFPGLERTDLAAWLPDRLRTWSDHPRATDVAVEPADDHPLWVMIHPDLFGELVDALVDNAFKYSRPGSAVVVRTGRDVAGPWVEVEDHGPGVPADEVGQLFRPFFRSAEARRQGVPGSGLGLAVAARVATALGGAMTVESEVGKGSRFRVRLPGAERGPAESGAAEARGRVQTSR